MNPARLRDFCRLIGYAARRRWSERRAARSPLGIYQPTSPVSLALTIAEEDRYRREYIRRLLEHPDPYA